MCASPFVASNSTHWLEFLWSCTFKRCGVCKLDCMHGSGELLSEKMMSCAHGWILINGEVPLLIFPLPYTLVTLLGGSIHKPHKSLHFSAFKINFHSASGYCLIVYSINYSSLQHWLIFSIRVGVLSTLLCQVL